MANQHPDDVIFIKKANTGTNSTETGSALHVTDNNWEFLLAPNRDIFCVKKANTSTNRTELHVLSAATGYRSFTMQIGTGLHPTDHTWTFALAANRDLFAIKKSGTSSGKVELLVLSAASNYQIATALTTPGALTTERVFFVAPSRDLVCIQKNNTPTKSTECRNCAQIIVLSAASNYQTICLQTGTGLHETDQNWAFGLLPNLDLLCVKKAGAGSTEVHILSAASQYKLTGTCLPPSDGNFAVCVSPIHETAAATAPAVTPTFGVSPVVDTRGAFVIPPGQYVPPVPGFVPPSQPFVPPVQVVQATPAIAPVPDPGHSHHGCYAPGHHYRGRKWSSGAVIVLKSVSSGKSLRILQDGSVNGLGQEGPWAQFIVHRTGPDTVKLQNVGDKNHWLRIEPNGHLNGKGSGGPLCEFRIIKHSKGTFSLRSVKHPEYGVGILPDGSPKHGGETGLGPHAQFVIKFLRMHQ